MVLTPFLRFLLPPVAFQVITDNGKYHRDRFYTFDCCISPSNLFFLPFYVIFHWIFRDRHFVASTTVPLLLVLLSSSRWLLPHATDNVSTRTAEMLVDC
jgi:hypothetical protein